MGRTDKKLRNEQISNPAGEYCSPAAGERVFRMLEGRWKLAILHHLFLDGSMRFSDLERALPPISQRMLTQRLRELERDRIVLRTVYPEAPPKVEYRLTAFGEALRPVLHAVLAWGRERAWA